MEWIAANSVRRLALASICPIVGALGATSAWAQTTPSAAPAPALTHHRHTHKAPAHHVAAAPAPSPSSAHVDPNAVPAPATVLAATDTGIATAASADNGETVIVTGTRNLGEKARDSTSPIDVISAATLARSGQPNLVDQLTRTDPSINLQAEGQDTQDLVSSIQLRGLSGNEVLVLVDGKRRHETSNIFADAGPQQGATPVDIDLIPGGGDRPHRGTARRRCRSVRLGRDRGRRQRHPEEDR